MPFESAVVWIGRGSEDLFKQAYGNAAIDSRFDLASLTKPLATALAIHHLVDHKLIDLDEPVSTYLPEWSSGKHPTTRVVDLLAHRSRLPIGMPGSLYVTSQTDLRGAIETVQRRIFPLSRPIYSDLNYLTLGVIVKAVSGFSLEDYVQQSIYAPMGLVATNFKTDKAIPTSHPAFKKRSGIPQDPFAAAVSPTSVGHAGLFSSADEIAKIIRMILQGGTYEGKQILSKDSIDRLTKGYGPLGIRTLGFDRFSAYARAPRGPISRDRSFGHTGHTGTSVWIDPTTGLFVITLTNRTYFGETTTTTAQVAAARYGAAKLAVQFLQDQAAQDQKKEPTEVTEMVTE